MPLSNETAQDPLTGIDIVRLELTGAIMQQPEVPREKSSKGAADRLVRAFLKGAGVTSDDATAEWSARRRGQATEGMRALIRAAITGRKRDQRYELVPVELPVEPVLADADAGNAYNDPYVKNRRYVGWQKNIMPFAAFDAKTTEWELAHILDRDDEIVWWLRLLVHGPAYIPTPRDPNYFPDFIAIDRDGTYWVIEGKADDNANDDSVLRKKGRRREVGASGSRRRRVRHLAVHVRHRVQHQAGRRLVERPSRPNRTRVIHVAGRCPA